MVQPAAKPAQRQPAPQNAQRRPNSGSIQGRGNTPGGRPKRPAGDSPDKPKMQDSGGNNPVKSSENGTTEAQRSARDFMYNDMFGKDSPLKGLPEGFKQSYSQNVGEHFSKQLSPDQQNQNLMGQGMLGENKQVEQAFKNSLLGGLSETIKENPGMIRDNAGQFLKAGGALAADYGETMMQNLAEQSRPRTPLSLDGSSSAPSGPANPLYEAGANKFGALRDWLSQ